MRAGPDSKKTSLLEKLNPRALAETYPGVAMILVLLGLASAIAWATYRFRHMDDKPIPNAYFVNDQTLQVEVRSTLQVPPITTREGDLVYGIYLACGDCCGTG